MLGTPKDVVSSALEVTVALCQPVNVQYRMLLYEEALAGAGPIGQIGPDRTGQAVRRLR